MDNFYFKSQFELNILKIEELDVAFKPGLPIYCELPTDQFDESKWLFELGFIGQSFEVGYEKPIIAFEHIAHSGHSKWISGKYVKNLLRTFYTVYNLLFS